jgi:hypothetical protein
MLGAFKNENLTLSQAWFDVWYLWNFLPQMQKFNKMNCGKIDYGISIS